MYVHVRLLTAKVLHAYLSLRESSDNKVSGVSALAGEGHRMVQGVA